MLKQILSTKPFLWVHPLKKKKKKKKLKKRSSITQEKIIPKFLTTFSENGFVCQNDNSERLNFQTVKKIVEI